MTVDKLTQTWGERMASEARRLIVRHRPHVPAVDFLVPFVRRVTVLPSSANRFARVEPGARRAAEPPPNDDAMPIPPDIRERLREAIGPGVERARVHQGPTADAVARAHGAEAVTIGNDILFRDGHYQPRNSQGFALLAHEATHVVASTSSTAVAARSTTAGVAAEEARARAVEARLFTAGSGIGASTAPSAWSPPSGQPFAPPPPPPSLATSTPSAPPTNGAPVAAKPMAAALDRAPAAPAPSTPPFDVNELKRSIYRELLQTIRSDAERGG